MKRCVLVLVALASTSAIAQTAPDPTKPMPDPGKTVCLSFTELQSVLESSAADANAQQKRQAAAGAISKIQSVFMPPRPEPTPSPPLGVQHRAPSLPRPASPPAPVSVPPAPVPPPAPAATPSASPSPEQHSN